MSNLLGHLSPVVSACLIRSGRETTASWATTWIHTVNGIRDNGSCKLMVWNKKEIGKKQKETKQYLLYINTMFYLVTFTALPHVLYPISYSFLFYFSSYKNHITKWTEVCLDTQPLFATFDNIYFLQQTVYNISICNLKISSFLKLIKCCIKIYKFSSLFNLFWAFTQKYSFNFLY